MIGFDQFHHFSSFSLFSTIRFHVHFYFDSSSFIVFQSFWYLFARCVMIHLVSACVIVFLTSPLFLHHISFSTACIMLVISFAPSLTVVHRVSSFFNNFIFLDCTSFSSYFFTFHHVSAFFIIHMICIMLHEFSSFQSMPSAFIKLSNKFSSCFLDFMRGFIICIISTFSTLLIIVYHVS